jgi:HAE1 family hydrophobic/amphiphilic exporter-1
VRDLTLRTYGRVGTPADFGNIPITNVNGTRSASATSRTIEDSMADVESAATVGGKSAVVLMIRKQSGTNAIEVVEGIKERVAEVLPTLPPGYKIDIIRDQSEFVLAAVGAVKEHLILGSIFAALVVWLFLSSPRFWHVLAMLAATLGMFWYFAKKSRPTLIAAVAIPSSLIATFAAMAYMHFTLNVITLLALTLAVGIVIDDAVVVLENIFRHMEEKGMTPAEAAVEGTKEVGLAVMATSMSLIVVFLPVAFMAGIVGRFMYSFGVTMAFAIAVSLLVSFTLTPMMAARYLKREDLSEEHGHARARLLRGHRARVHGDARLVDGASLGDRAADVPRLQLDRCRRSAVRARRQDLPAVRRRRAVRGHRARAGRASVATTQTIAESIASRVRKLDGVEHRRHHRRRSAADAQPRSRLREARTGQRIAPTSTRSWTACARKCCRSTAPEPAHAGRPGQRIRRRHGRRGHVLDRRTGPGAARQVRARADGCDQGSEARHDRRRHELHRRQAGAGRAHRSRQSRPTSACACRISPSTLNVLVGGQKATSYYEGGEEYEVHVRAEEASRNDAGISQIEVPSANGTNVKLATRRA